MQVCRQWRPRRTHVSDGQAGAEQGQGGDELPVCAVHLPPPPDQRCQPCHEQHLGHALQRHACGQSNAGARGPWDVDSSWCCISQVRWTGGSAAAGAGVAAGLPPRPSSSHIFSITAGISTLEANRKNQHVRHARCGACMAAAAAAAAAAAVTSIFATNSQRDRRLPPWGLPACVDSDQCTHVGGEDKPFGRTGTLAHLRSGSADHASHAMRL